MSRPLKILIPHDLHNDYLNLIPLINQFESKAQFSEICLYYAYEPPNLGGKIMPDTFLTLLEQDKKNIRKTLENQAEIFRGLLDSNTSVQFEFNQNKPVAGIYNFAKEYNPDIIMVIAHRKLGVTKYINNSRILKLLNLVDSPVLVMPYEYEVNRPLRLNFLIQHFENLELAKKLSAPITDVFSETKYIHRDPNLSKIPPEEIELVDSIERYIQTSSYDETFMLIRKKKNKLQTALTKGFVGRLVGLNQAPVIIQNE